MRAESRAGVKRESDFVLVIFILDLEGGGTWGYEVVIRNEIAHQ